MRLKILFVGPLARIHHLIVLLLFETSLLFMFENRIVNKGRSKVLFCRLYGMVPYIRYGTLRY